MNHRCRTLLTLGAVWSGSVLISPLQAQSIRLTARVEDLEAAVRTDSCDAAARYNLAIGYLSRNRFEQADSALLRAVALDPQFAVAYFALSLAQDRNERYWNQLRRQGGDSAVIREARRRVAFERKAFLIDPFVDVRLLGSVMRRGYVSLGVNSAIEHLAEGDYIQAYQEFDRQLSYLMGTSSRDSISASFLWLHSLAAAHTDHLAEATADVQSLLRKSLAHERDDSTHTEPLRTNEYRYMLATLHQRSGRTDQALALYQEVIANDIGNYMAHVQMARIYELQRDWDRALAERRAAAEVNPEDHTVLYDLGAAYTRAGRWADAEDPLARSRDMQPRYPRSWYALGVTRQQLGNSAGAREAFTGFLAIAPSRMSAQVNDARTRLAALP